MKPRHYHGRKRVFFYRLQKVFYLRDLNQRHWRCALQSTEHVLLGVHWLQMLLMFIHSSQNIKFPTEICRSGCAIARTSRDSDRHLTRFVMGATRGSKDSHPARFLVVSCSSLKIQWYFLKAGHYRLLPHPLEPIIHRKRTICCYTGLTRGLDTYGSGWKQVAGFCEHGDETSQGWLCFV
jgi:hypothetical protein